MNKILVIVLASAVFILIDLYVFQAVKIITQGLSAPWRKGLHLAYWAVTFLTLAGFWTYHMVNPDNFSRVFRSFLLVGVFMNYMSKSLAVVFLMIDDIIRAGQWVVQQFYKKEVVHPDTDSNITRSDFLVKTALVAAAIPFATMSFGILSGAHDYRIRRKTVFLPNLPKAFDGITIGQLSDVHSGSFFNKRAVKGGVEMLMQQKPDTIFFTGDLVNSVANEMRDYQDIFSGVKAPLGVYSTLGNHDYGDYASWKSPEAKKRNLDDLIATHKHMGWDLLMNENRRLKVDGEEIAVLGIENWGGGRFAKYGKIKETYQGSEDAPVKLLLSHDPSHWDAQVRTMCPDIDIMFAGHTHGFQFGVEIGDFKWSPSQYAYKQWAGLYQEGSQYLYVNRGFGYIGYPGRIGIPPEITLLELKRA
ncbi:metallophosphoesterase [Cytophagales bacterium LB-30]|uniref:Metallophosphoesterase n=1 Tax=Shiella aurantiaca TaxID=3058365 RepID=A0ABT8F3U2_9BACT|nr:metallophosphoesterase [Shiella aurantiaca]MDN4164891.1 metallophosphoesterase [Shiella aurantiaca]